MLFEKSLMQLIDNKNVENFFLKKTNFGHTICKVTLLTLFPKQSYTNSYLSTKQSKSDVYSSRITKDKYTKN